MAFPSSDEMTDAAGRAVGSETVSLYVIDRATVDLDRPFGRPR